ncbi:uncharacterized protein LOC135830154 [Sycon ciliatum]|uniref:uncharacterized protein LOC135830154 n=1 Tax=Sycon ciliatum TaxID=27933 RepID=UPI0031F72162
MDANTARFLLVLILAGGALGMVIATSVVPSWIVNTGTVDDERLRTLIGLWRVCFDLDGKKTQCASIYGHPDESIEDVPPSWRSAETCSILSAICLWLGLLSALVVQCCCCIPPLTPQRSAVIFILPKSFLAAGACFTGATGVSVVAYYSELFCEIIVCELGTMFYMCWAATGAAIMASILCHFHFNALTLERHRLGPQLLETQEVVNYP